MAHHGPPPDDLDQTPIAKAIREQQKELQETFKTAKEMDQWPRGMITQHDEGVLSMSVTGKDGKVILAFAEPTAWVGLEPKQAMELAQTLIKWATRESKGVLTLEYPY